ncbi:MAG: hypothetical protein B7X95_08760 [Methylophilaceae bacterium 17-44-8]|jgi:hypothetical protein|nr:MAG: hypothetical protein B7Y48_07235 [Methylophilales bacterium 28-44-11]OYZ09701.1 MAG: hypothetical protein B7Y32_01500 [Methylophilales bacterium 16-45-7]OZA04835.1 MAG: hypothetical protein B7X95_08760 [Methylophilaceae bacterium 17-44-8]
MKTQHSHLIYLYTTSACHLCEIAEQLLSSIQTSTTVQTIEITDDDNLILKYGEIIPVLYRSDNHKELHWPFTVDEIKFFLHD